MYARLALTSETATMIRIRASANAEMPAMVAAVSSRTVVTLVIVVVVVTAGKVTKDVT